MSSVENVTRSEQQLRLRRAHVRISELLVSSQTAHRLIVASQLSRGALRYDFQQVLDGKLALPCKGASVESEDGIHRNVLSLAVVANYGCGWYQDNTYFPVGTVDDRGRGQPFPVVPVDDFETLNRYAQGLARIGEKSIPGLTPDLMTVL